jgi:hypothetical protein
MACGNNDISRDYLSSQPANSSSQADSLFSGRIDHSAAKNELPVYNSRQHRKQFDPKDVWFSKTNQYRGNDPRGPSQIHELIGRDGRPTKDHPHVHVITNTRTGQVELHLTENTRLDPVHSHHLRLPGPATRVQADRAITELLGVLNDPNHVSRFQ